MPRNRPQTSGYAKIAQFEEEEEEDVEEDEVDYGNNQRYRDDGDVSQTPGAIFRSAFSNNDLQPNRRDHMFMPERSSSPRRPGRRRMNSGVDIRAINQRLERWAEDIKERFKFRRVHGKSARDEHLEIYSSVFQAPDWIRPATKAMLEEEDDKDAGVGLERLSKQDFDDRVESVRTAIELDVHPSLIAQGSSGSYFARNSRHKVLAVFKPKDEEPYANKNPKWTKWIHRNLFPFAFGRVCLIPNLSYVSEAAAYILDVQLRTGLVPYTDVVSLSSKSFHYDYFDRRASYRKGITLPEKQGSFQIFLNGFKGATEFFKEHPWPDELNTSARETSTRRNQQRWDDCGPGSAERGDDDEDDNDETRGRASSSPRPEFWTRELQQSFREELERLVVLDYIMRNTDRGTDNWMIRMDKVQQNVPETADRETQTAYHQRTESMTTQQTASTGTTVMPSIGAIDNSLSWPWKHPDAWRSYPFGWLFLPVSLIGRPFSERTRQHFLPLLTSKEWWTDTQVKLRKCFELDADFKEKMFARQMAVMKGQAWNVVETLKTPDHGPLELTRRTRVLVWDDIVEVPVAVPLTRPSEELQRAAAAVVQEPERPEMMAEDEELDISAALTSETSPLKPVENRFNISRQSSAQDVSDRSAAGLTSPTSNQGQRDGLTPTSSPLRPGQRRSKTGEPRMSYESPRARWNKPAERRRRFSFGSRRAAAGLRSAEDEDDGDLGYTAARDLESSRRRVIVERLEMVKSKAPFFQWC